MKPCIQALLKMESRLFRLLSKNLLLLLAGFWLLLLFQRPLQAIEQKEDKRPWSQIISNSKDPKALKILFVGHSKFYINNLPGMFATITKIQNPKLPLKVGCAYGSSYTLQEQWNNKLAKKTIRDKGPWDFVVFIARSGYPVKKPEEVEVYLNLFNQELKTTKSTMVLTENFTVNKNEYPKIHIATQKLAKKFNCPVLPIGTAWNLVRISNPDIKLFASDNHHPNVNGTYLMASVCYSFFLNKKSQFNTDDLQFKVQGQKGRFRFKKKNVETFHNAAWYAVKSSKSEKVYSDD